jgi:hypothetical protein
VVTTILTLLPTILTYASLPSADFSELYCLNRPMAFWTSVMTLALPIQFKHLTPPGHERYLRARDILAETNHLFFSQPASSVVQPNRAQSLSDLHSTCMTSRILNTIQTAALDNNASIPMYKVILVACIFVFIQASLLPVVSSLVWNLSWLCPD